MTLPQSDDFIWWSLTIFELPFQVLIFAPRPWDPFWERRGVSPGSYTVGPGL